MTRRLLLLLLTLITIVGGFLRFYGLGSTPAGVYVDEAAIGYSAFSLLRTQRDEFGQFLPIVFRSFVDFKTPVHIYLTVIPVWLLGLSAFSVRFISALAGTLAIPGIYLLVHELLPSRTDPEGNAGRRSDLKRIPSNDERVHDVVSGRSDLIAFVASLLLALSPWHLLFSRTAFECNLALTLFVFGLIFFYRSLKHSRYLLLSSLFLSLSAISYHSYRVIVPLVLIALFIRYYKQVIATPRHLFTAIGLGLLVLTPTLLIINTAGFWARASGLNIFARSDSLYSSLREFFSLYFAYHSPRYLFFLGDYRPQTAFPDLSTFFVWQLPFYLAGLFTLLKSRYTELKFLIITLLIIGPLPSAITRDPYSTIRSLQLVIPQVVIIALGITQAHAWVTNIFPTKLEGKARSAKGVLTGIILIVVIFSLFQIYSSVFILNDYHRSADWSYGYRQLYSVLNNLPPLATTVDDSRGEPYIELLFFGQFDPATYQQNNQEVSAGEYYTSLTRAATKHLGLITTRPIDWPRDLIIDQYLVGDHLSISEDQIKTHHLSLLSTINYPDGSPAFRIVRTNPDYELKLRSKLLQ